MTLNRQPGPMNENALQMLRDKELKKGADVQTADGEQLGKALSIHHRPPEEVDPELKLYGSYLEVPNLLIGSHFFVPIEFIADYDAEVLRVDLSVPLSAVMDETWDREPTFIAGSLDKAEELAT